MEYNSHLTEATLLKRSYGFLTEVVLPGGQRTMIRCPNLGPMTGCDTLGSKIWYSNAVGYHCLPTWELVEVDGGHFVCINPEIVKSLVIDAIENSYIKEFKDYKISYFTNLPSSVENKTILIESTHEKCIVGIEYVTFGNDIGTGLFPESFGQGKELLDVLLNTKKNEKCRVVLLYVVMHSGLSGIKTASLVDPEYSKILDVASKEGIELLAYKIVADPKNIELKVALPIAAMTQEC